MQAAGSAAATIPMKLGPAHNDRRLGRLRSDSVGPALSPSRELSQHRQALCESGTELGSGLLRDGRLVVCPGVSLAGMSTEAQGSRWGEASMGVFQSTGPRRRDTSMDGQAGMQHEEVVPRAQGCSLVRSRSLDPVVDTAEARAHGCAVGEVAMRRRETWDCKARPGRRQLGPCRCWEGVQPHVTCL